MQDKEFDQLFRSRLEQLEVEPSKAVWDNIAADVILDRPNRSAVPYISIAATILVLIGVGVYFIPNVKTAGGGATHNTVARAKVQPQPVTKIAEPIKPISPASPSAGETTIAASSVSEVKEHHNGIQPAVSQVVKIEPEVQAPEVTTIAEERPTVLAAVKPDADLLEPQTMTNAVAVTAKPVVAPDANAEPPATVRPRKKGIRSFGDLINVVVSKVDKRKDKLIEFSSKDEDDSMITGVNLGILKIKKEETIATNK